MICFGISVGTLSGLTPITERIQRSYVPVKVRSIPISGNELTTGDKGPTGFAGPRTIVVLPECSSCDVNLPLLPFKRPNELETLFLAPGDVTGWARLASKGTSRVIKTAPEEIRRYNADFQPRTYHINSDGKLDYVQQNPKEFEVVISELNGAVSH